MKKVIAMNGREEQMNDLICRQAAIDEAKEWIDAVYFEENDKRERKAIECFIGSLKNMPSAQPDLDELCTDCSEYDQERHCCPRWNRVIRQTLKDAQPERKTGEWMPCSERLPEELEEVNVTWVNHKPEPYYDFVKDKPFTASAVYYKGDWYWYSSVCTDLLAERGENEIDKIDDAIEITAWMPLPEPYKGEES